MEYPPKEFLSVEEVSRLLDLKEQTIRDYIHRGELIAYKFGKIWRIRKSDFDLFVEKHRSNRKEH